ncbi:hypothetical protein RF11_00712 [Thelohanellus kitauei]|uniref:Uncharacterized protein n=1 Tax=Thelohanellus kitauei TaxID=669202 RepID=A0A0C2JA35_THEKT|nr:hypothetical protein RF11_00712 [Thelohanellus kitauei]
MSDSTEVLRHKIENMTDSMDRLWLAPNEIQPRINHQAHIKRPKPPTPTEPQMVVKIENPSSNEIKSVECEIKSDIHYKKNPRIIQIEQKHNKDEFNDNLAEIKPIKMQKTRYFFGCLSNQAKNDNIEDYEYFQRRLIKQPHRDPRQLANFEKPRSNDKKKHSSTDDSDKGTQV